MPIFIRISAAAAMTMPTNMRREYLSFQMIAAVTELARMTPTAILGNTIVPGNTAIEAA